MQKLKYLFCLLFCFSAVSFRLYAQTLDDALNVPGGTLQFTSYCQPSTLEYPWTVVIDEEMTHDGVAAARSGATGYFLYGGIYRQSILQTSLNNPGMLRLWFKSNGSCFLQITAADDIVNTLSATNSWHFESVKIYQEGEYDLEFRFNNWSTNNNPHGQTEHYFLLDDISWHPADENGFVFALNADQESYSLLSYLGESDVITVPSQHLDKPVTVIGEKAFDKIYGLKKIILRKACCGLKIILSICVVICVKLSCLLLCNISGKVLFHNVSALKI